MNKIYLQYDNTGLVTVQHFQPLDNINGIKDENGEHYNTFEDLVRAKGGICVDSIPTPDSEKLKTQDAVLYVDLETKALYYVYTDRPQTDQDRLANVEMALAAIMGGVM